MLDFPKGADRCFNLADRSTFTNGLAGALTQAVCKWDWEDGNILSQASQNSNSPHRTLCGAGLGKNKNNKGKQIYFKQARSQRRDQRRDTLELKALKAES